MTRTLSDYRVFIASPGGLESERTTFRDVLSEHNINEANQRGANFTPEGWEITLGGVGRPQSIINKQIKECDYFVLILHDRWGSSPSANTEISEYSSATEEEFMLAKKSLEDPELPMQDIIIFFKAVDANKLSDPGEQLKQVLSFRKEREVNKDFLYNSVDSIDNFRRKLRRHISDWIRKHENLNDEKTIRNIIGNTSKPKFHLSNQKTIGLSENPDEEALLSDAERQAESGNQLDAELAFAQIMAAYNSPISYARFARFLKKIGQCDRASKLLDRAFELASITDDEHANAYAYRQMARVQVFTGNRTNGMEFYLKALAIYERINNLEGEARTRRDISSLYRNEGNIESAKEELIKAEKLYAALKSEDGLASVYGYLGLILKNEGKLPEALRYHTKALNIQEKSLNDRAIAIIKGNIGVVLRMQSKLNKSETFHQESLDYYKKVGEAQGMARELGNLGVVSRLKNNYEDAKKYHYDSLSICEKSGNTGGVAIQYGNLGYIAMKENSFEEAEKYFDKSMDISKKQNNRTGIAMQLEHLGELNYYRKEYELAKTYYFQALGIYRDTDNSYGMCNTKEKISDVYLALCDKKESKRWKAKAKPLCKELRRVS